MHAAAHLEAAEPGEHQVEHDEIRLALAKDLQRLLAVGGRDDDVAIAPQVQTHHLADVRLVVDD
jgi:hypothetical protein